MSDGGSILVVEDDAGVCTLERLRLERAGFHVMTAATAAEAESRLLANSIEILILDNHLPDGVEGIEFYQRMQDNGHNVPVILVTGFSDEATAIRALKTGVRDFITKSPEFLDYLPDAVRRVLRQVRMERQLAVSEAALREKEAHLRVFVEHMPAIFFAIARDLRISRAMGAGLAALQVTAEQLQGRTLAECFPSDPPDFPLAAAAQRALCGEHVTLEFEWRGRSFQVHLEPLPGPDGAIAECVGVATDTTDQKHWQKHLLRSERLESLGTLAGGIAHDLNNVLTPIVMAVDLLRMTSTDETAQMLLTTLQASAQRGADMVRQILSYARGSQGQHQPMAVEPVLRELVKLLGQTLPKTIEVRLEIAPGLPLVHGNATQVHQLLMNLCVNARDAMPQGGSLTLRASGQRLDEVRAHSAGARPGDYVVLTVTDTGIGIPAELLDKIFDPFFTTKPQGQGTGLGLFNVAGIVKNHGGFLDLHSEVGKGTSFAVYLPALAALALSQEVAPPPAPVMAQGEHILVVDDEPAIRDILRATLEAAGYKVLTAADGAAAVALFAQHRRQIQVVIMDMMMPVMDGGAALRAIHAIEPRVPAIVASGYHKKQTMEIPPFVKEVLPKPFTSQALLQAVQQVLHGAGERK